MSSSGRSKQEAGWDHLPDGILGGISRHLRQPLRTAGTETISQVCRTWSQAADFLVEPEVDLDLEVSSTSAATSLAAWLRRRARCIKSLRLAHLPAPKDAEVEQTAGLTLAEQLQQEKEATMGILVALHEAAMSSAARGERGAAAAAAAAAPPPGGGAAGEEEDGGRAAEAGAATPPPPPAAAAAGPLGLEGLTLRGRLACYPELGGLLAALPHLQGLQLCADMNVVSEYSTNSAFGTPPLEPHLTVLGGFSNLRALRIDDALDGLGRTTWHGVLPSTLTALTLVVDDDMINGGYLTHLVNLRQLYLTDFGEHLGQDKVLHALTTVEGIMALPALQEVHVGERSVGWEALVELAPKLVTLRAKWGFPEPEADNWEQLGRLTALTALEMPVFQRNLDDGWELPPLPRLRRLHLIMMDEEQLLREMMTQVGALPQLEDLYLELHLEDQAGGCYMWYVPGLALPTSLTRLTGFTLQYAWHPQAEKERDVYTFHPWYQLLAPLQQLHSLGIPQSMLLRESHGLKQFTALTSLTLFVGREGREEAPDGFYRRVETEPDNSELPVGALEQVAEVGQQLQELVVVGCHSSRLMGRALQRVVAPTCKVRQLRYPVL